MDEKTFQIKLKLLEKGYTQRDISKCLGISDGAISLLVNRKSKSKRFDKWVKKHLGIDL